MGELGGVGAKGMLPPSQIIGGGEREATNVESTLSLRTFDTSLFFYSFCMSTLPYISAIFTSFNTAQLVKERMSSYGSKFFPLLTATVEDAGKMKITVAANEIIPIHPKANSNR